MPNPVASPTDLPRSGRVLQSDIKRIRMAVLDAALERDKPKLEAAVKPVQQAIVQAYRDAISPEDVEVCRKYRLLDYRTRDVVNFWRPANDDWHQLPFTWTEAVEVPQNFSLSFYAGGLSDEVRARPRIIDLSACMEHLETIHSIARETAARAEAAQKFAAGYHDGNKTVRPLWSEVYDKFPELKRRRAL